MVAQGTQNRENVMIKFIGGAAVGLIIGLLVGAFHPKEVKSQASSLTNQASSAVAKGASSAAGYASDKLKDVPTSN